MLIWFDRFGSRTRISFGRESRSLAELDLSLAWMVNRVSTLLLSRLTGGRDDQREEGGG